MHLKKSQARIGEESSGVSSDYNPTPPRFPPPPIQFQTHSIQQSKTHLPPNQPQAHARISSSQYPSKQTHQHQSHHQTQFHEHPSTPKTILSHPHKRPIMTHMPSALSHSPTLSSLNHNHRHHHQHQTQLDSPLPSASQLFVCTSLVAFAKALAFKLLHHFRNAGSLRIHLRVFILLSLPPLYFFTWSPRRSLVLDFLSALAFSAAVVISLNLALPRLPSIRVFLARSLPIKLCSSASSASKPSQPVLWSIGSKPKSEKRTNSGSWVQVYTNGDVYEGEFHKGKCSGSGVYYYYMSGRYEGDWVDEKYDGYGVETWAKGSRFRGQYRQGLRHGIGVYRFYTGDVYAGEWSNGQTHGCGVHTCEDGSRYVGEFKWGVKHGFGHYHFRNGDMYAGEYFADKMHGFGVYRFANGHRYEGAWHEGRRQGLGMYTFRNGEAQSGHWQNGVLDVPSTQNTHPASPFAVSHSKVLNAVQEARRAAEKAFDVAKVDERVNKAVALANKAANAARVAAVKAVQKRVHHNSDSSDTPLPIV
ncbi:uncharacterized protein LOC117934439 isoform X2 [Vitis riparia]|uniref:uncharacterized protein LOC117934439 isoform X2 n=1 Tax=Vitis riparia TaxID=96939 RepID=UPI00155A59C8|nr:uncharacterized protein LOC117934439 isoform X2 [Vitis riparia]